MTLRKIHAGCNELLSLTNDEWLIATEKQQEEARKRIDALREEVANAVMLHNDAVEKTIKKQHGDATSVRLKQLPWAERLLADLERITLPEELDCKKPLPDAETEAMLAALPEDVGDAHRFATMVVQQLPMLEFEADLVHEQNRRGKHIDRAHVRHGPVGNDPHAA